MSESGFLKVQFDNLPKIGVKLKVLSGQYTRCGYEETGLISLLISVHFDNQEDDGAMTMWTPLYCHTKLHSRVVVSFAMTRVRGRSCVRTPVTSLFTASTDSNLVPGLHFRKRKKSNSDVQSLECFFFAK